MESISFDRIADRYDETRGGMDRARDVAVAVVPVLMPGTVMEVGIGTGVIAAALAEHGRQVVGVDLSPAMLLHAAARLGPRVAVGDAQQLPVRSGGCDNVLLVWVMHLVGDPVAALVEARRVLADEGRVVIAPRLVTPPDLYDDVEAIFYAMHALLHRDVLEPTSVLEQAEAAGLALVARTMTRPRPVGESPLAAAERIESRTFSSLWDVDDATWAAVVEPAITGLRALPAPDRPRDRSVSQELLVFTAMDRQPGLDEARWW
jgi:ubiquinone/menaquinone biosynthesis C-methylase UbiE